jgi:site-specific DNA-methyltransferase (adenine-specific)
MIRARSQEQEVAPVACDGAPHILIHADMLEACRHLGAAPLFDLVYLDPPFNVGGEFVARLERGQARGLKKGASSPRAYDDSWGGRHRFLAMLRPRLAAVHQLLTPRATLYLHLDHRTAHYAKVMCDDLFGAGAFRGEIIWVPGNGGRRKRGPSITHQTILVFTKDTSATGKFIWNEADPMLREPYADTSLEMHFRSRTADGRAFRERRIGPRTYRYYADAGRRIGSVWTDAPAMVANTPIRREATGYPTQKPERLLERIIRASSLPGDVVADLMCGSGTSLVVAARLGRRFIGADASPLAIEITSQRLARERIAFRRMRV